MAESGTAPSSGSTTPPMMAAGRPRSSNSSAPSEKREGSWRHTKTANLQIWYAYYKTVQQWGMRLTGEGDWVWEGNEADRGRRLTGERGWQGNEADRGTRLTGERGWQGTEADRGTRLTGERGWQGNDADKAWNMQKTKAKNKKGGKGWNIIVDNMWADPLGWQCQQCTTTIFLQLRPCWQSASVGSTPQCYHVGTDSLVYTCRSWMWSLDINILLASLPGLHTQLLSLAVPRFAFHTASDKSWAWRPGTEANILPIKVNKQ